MNMLLSIALVTSVWPGSFGTVIVEQPLQDEFVLNVVLVHFLADFADEAGHFGRQKPIVFLDERNPTTTGLLDQTLNLARNRNGHSEAIENVLTRSRGKNFQTKPISYGNLRLDKRVHVGPMPVEDFMGGLDDILDKYKGLLSVHAPGYSKDGKTAVVVAFCSPGIHPTAVVYYLKRQEAAWTVKWRQFVWYV